MEKDTGKEKIYDKKTYLEESLSSAINNIGEACKKIRVIKSTLDYFYNYSSDRDTEVKCEIFGNKLKYIEDCLFCLNCTLKVISDSTENFKEVRANDTGQQERSN